MSKFDEQIIVVPREIIFNNEKNTFNGFLNKNKPEGQNIFDALSQYEVKRRGDMEEIHHINNSFLIVYLKMSMARY